MTQALLRAEGLHKSYGGLVATRHLDLDLHAGEIHAMIGPNGAGKTTAMGQLSGELAPDAGRIVLDGEDVTRLSMPARARRGIARSYQITAVFEEFTVRQNVAVAVQAMARHHFRMVRPARRDPELNAGAEEALGRVGLLHLADEVAADLAHGQKRQLELAMVLATRPRVLLLDEPMAGMGNAEVDAMTRLLEELRSHYAILLVEHDMDVVFRVADRTTVLVDGAVLASGAPEAIRSDARVQAAYLEESA
ncbi:ABC transporter ATP-binding protein [Aquisalimonas lutea]|uniref:ABC transporter ATP-binding protein n=1 Tax=Aquisalimonas lutea TaxID=1327750 RepID=UPI0025B4B06D|nr:ABC transporter ATP-binding protein [Aquisalimonas lutea]MDN3519502.1 ABC transporter ATP-binding protein [Aquisalimonas lutea]